MGLLEDLIYLIKVTIKLSGLIGLTSRIQKWIQYNIKREKKGQFGKDLLMEYQHQ